MNFRKKPIVIEARQLPPREPVTQEAVTELQEICRWSGARVVFGGGVLIDTLEGVMRAEPGDWVVRGVAGEFYPCKPDIFAATYDRVEP